MSLPLASTFATALLVLSLFPTICSGGQPPDTTSDWSSVSHRASGRFVVVRLDQKVSGKKKVRGVVERVDDAGLIIRSDRSGQVRLPREAIRRIVVYPSERRRRYRGRIIGAAAGGVLLGRTEPSRRFYSSSQNHFHRGGGGPRAARWVGPRIGNDARSSFTSGPRKGEFRDSFRSAELRAEPY